MSTVMGRLAAHSLPVSQVVMQVLAPSQVSQFGLVMHEDVGGTVPQATHAGMFGFTQRLVAEQSAEVIHPLLHVFPLALQLLSAGQSDATCEKQTPVLLHFPAGSSMSATHVPPQT